MEHNCGSVTKSKVKRCVYIYCVYSDNQTLEVHVHIHVRCKIEQSFINPGILQFIQMVVHGHNY